MYFSYSFINGYEQHTFAFGEIYILVYLRPSRESHI